MDSAARPNARRRRHRLAVAGAVVLAALTAPAATAMPVMEGRVTAFDAPPGPITLILGNNNRGQIVGASATGGVTDGGPVPAVRGFLLRRGLKGPSTPIAFPGAANTLPNGINDLGQIVGGYQNPTSRRTHRAPACSRRARCPQRWHPADPGTARLGTCDRCGRGPHAPRHTAHAGLPISGR